MSNPITLVPGNLRFDARADETVLDAALRAGHLLPHSCRNGSCGSCRARVVSGAWHYRDGVEPPGLSAAERATGAVLLCRAVAEGALVAEAQPVVPAGEHTIRTLPCRIERMDRLTHDTMALFLKLPAVERLEFRAGQYLDILLEDHTRRSYSIATPPHDDALIELHVRARPGGAFSERVFTQLQPRALLRIEGPLGTFFLRESPGPVLMVAGGTGYAPFKAMLGQALAVAGTRRFELWWGVREARDLYDTAVLDAWRARHPRFSWHAVTGGFVHEAVLARHGRDLGEHDVYVAGPPAMVRTCKETFAAAAALYTDAFEPGRTP